MSDFFLGEIRLFAIGFAPSGWLPCQGQLLNINTNQALYSLLGTQFGGDAKTTFGLPDLRGRVPMCVSPTYLAGKSGGEANHTLLVTEMPEHSHEAYASDAAPNTGTPSGNFLAGLPGAYSTANETQMNNAAYAVAGASQSHNNMQPYSVLNFCISITGLYPPHP